MRNNNKFESVEFSKIIKDSCRINSFNIARAIISQIISNTLTRQSLAQNLVGAYWGMKCLDSNDIHRNQLDLYLNLILDKFGDQINAMDMRGCFEHIKEQIKLGLPLDQAKLPPSIDAQFALSEELKTLYKEAHSEQKFLTWVPIFDDFEAHMQYSDAF